MFFAVSKFWYLKASDLKLLVNFLVNNLSIKKLISKKFIFIATILLVLANITLYLISNSVSPIDYIYVQFIGYGFGYFNILTFSTLLIVMCTPLFFQSYFLQEQLQNNYCFVKIRYGNRLAYLKQLLLTFMVFATLFIILFSAITFLGSFVVALKNGMSLNDVNNNFIGLDFWTVITKALLLKWLEIYMVLLLSLTISIYTKNTGLSFFIPLIGYLLNVINIKMNKYNPFGISSMIRWGVESDYNISFLNAVLILCMINIILITFLISKGQKRII